MDDYLKSQALSVLIEVPASVIIGLTLRTSSKAINVVIAGMYYWVPRVVSASQCGSLPGGLWCALWLLKGQRLSQRGTAT